MLKYLPRLLPYIRPYYRLAGASVLLMALAALLGLLSPWPLKILVDNVIGQAPLPAVAIRVLGGSASQSVLLVLTVVGALVLATLVGGLNVLNSYVDTKLEQ